MRIQKQRFTNALQKSCLKNFVIFSGTHLRPSGLQLYYKETPTQVVSCKICEIFKSTFFYRSPPVAAS